ncbi:MAG: M64 family metallopeptidase [Candidatus Pacearchaeota archaeon]
MEKKFKILIIINILFLLIITLIIFFSFKPIIKSPNSGNCNIIKINGEPSDKIDIVFLTDNLDEVKLLELSNLYINEIFNFTPFSSAKTKFNFYYIPNKTTCEINNNFLFCYNKQTIQLASSCNYDYIFVLSSRNSIIRSSAYMGIGSININSPKQIILHEFGHLFANLADEYVPSSLPFNQKNCFSSCNYLHANSYGCYQGCSNNNYFRSSQNSIMRSLFSKSYYELNENIIKNYLEKYK